MGNLADRLKHHTHINPLDFYSMSIILAHTYDDIDFSTAVLYSIKKLHVDVQKLARHLFTTPDEILSWTTCTNLPADISKKGYLEGIVDFLLSDYGD